MAWQVYVLDLSTCKVLNTMLFGKLGRTLYSSSTICLRIRYLLLRYVVILADRKQPRICIQSTLGGAFLRWERSRRRRLYETLFAGNHRSAPK